MYSSKNNKILKIITCIAVFFSFNTIANAATYYEKKQTDNLYDNCSNSNKCVPICIYKCRRDIPQCKVANNDNAGDYAYIGHYYSGEENETDGIQNIWEIGVLPTISNSYANLYTWKNDKLMVADNFSYGDLGNVDAKGDTIFPGSWANTQAYKDVNESFKCPKYMESETPNMLTDNGWFENKGELKVGFTDVEYFDSLKELSYSFIDEFEEVLTRATPQSYNDFVGPSNLKDVYFFMEKAAGYTEYNESLSEEQNSQKLCTFLKNKAGNSKESVENFVNDFSNNPQAIKAIINERLKQSIGSARSFEVYNYDSLNSLFEGKRIVDKNNVSYYKRINNIYTISERNAISYFNDKCNLGISEEQLEEIETKTSEKVMETLDSTTHQLKEIDFNTKFDCSSLFSGEIAKIISSAYFILEMVALALVIILSVIGYMGVIMNGESDEIKKENQKLIKRIIILVVLFILPALVNSTLRLFHIEGFDSENPLCVRISNK